MMLRLLLLLLFATSADAQTALETPVPQPLTTADTVRAVHNLFKSRRNTGGWLVYGSAGVTAIVGVGTLVDDNGKNCGGYFCPDAAGAALLIGIGTAPAWIPGTATLLRYTRKREQRALAEYARTGKLPGYVRRNLAGRFFNENYRFSKVAHR